MEPAGAGLVAAHPGAQYGGCFFLQRLGVSAGAVDHDDKVVGIAGNPPRALAVLPAFLPLVFGSHLRLPLSGEVVIQCGQRDVGQQRESIPSEPCRVTLFPVAVGRHDPGFEERLDQRACP